MNGEQFWISVWMIVAVCFIVLTLTFGVGASYRSWLVLEAVKLGADPIAARCAIVGQDAYSAGICGAAAGKVCSDD